MELLNLQNGSDIRGAAMGEHAVLTPDAVRRIGYSFGEWIKARSGIGARVAVGRDSRVTGSELSWYFAQGLALSGIKTADFGLASTPAMYMSTVREGFMYDGAVMVTASHLPMDRNGFKFFTREGGLEKSDILEILKAAQTYPSLSPPYGTSVSHEDFLSVYAHDMAEMIREKAHARDYLRPLKGKRIVVDAGNGAGGFFADKVLKPLGADISGSVFLEPDGRFPTHSPNPEDPAAMKSVQDAVIKNNADFGIIFDADVDRAAAVLEGGRGLNRNGLIAMMAAIELREHPNATIVTDSITSVGLKSFIEKRGGVHRRFKRGYRNVINEAKRLNSLGVDCPLAMETSGHGAFRDNYFLDDGAYLIAKLLIEIARGEDGSCLENLIYGLEEPLEAKEFRLRITEPDFSAYGDLVLKKMDEYAAEKSGWRVEADNYEGVRVNIDGAEGWFLIRMSLHDPLIPLNIESDVPGGVRMIAAEVMGFLNRFSGLDLGPLSGIC